MVYPSSFGVFVHPLYYRRVYRLHPLFAQCRSVSLGAGWEQDVEGTK